MPELEVDGNTGGRADKVDTRTEYDSDALEAKLEAQMSALGGGEEELDDEVVDDESEDVVKDDNADEEDDSQAGQEDEESEDEEDVVQDGDDSEDEEIGDEEEAADTPAKKSGTPTLPDSYIRSLKAQQWTDDEIKQNLDLLGSKFVEIAANIHSKRNAEVARWAEAGRKAQDATETQQRIDQGPVVEGIPQQLQPIDLKAMKEKFGEDEFIDESLAPLNAVIKTLNAVLPQIQQGVNSLNQNHLDEANNRVHKFFDDTKMDPFRKFYGGDEQERTPDQLDKRKQVLANALMIMKGAEAEHREFTLEQSLEMAHDNASAEFRERSVRRTIKKQVKKRNRGITQRPSKRGSKASSSSSGKELTAAQLERKVAAQLRATFR